MIHLESKGVLKNKFNSQFRTKKPWTIDWSDYKPDLTQSDDPVVNTKIGKNNIDKKIETKKEPD